MQKARRLIRNLAKITGKWDIANQLIKETENRTIKQNMEECGKTMKGKIRYLVGEYEAIYRNLLAEMIGWENRGKKGKKAEEIMISLGYSSYKLRKERWRRFIENTRRNTNQIRETGAFDNLDDNEVVGDGISTSSASLGSQTTRSVTDCPEVIPHDSQHTPGNHTQHDYSSGSVGHTSEDTGDPGNVPCIHKLLSPKSFGVVDDLTNSPSELVNMSRSNQGLDSTSTSYFLHEPDTSPIPEFPRTPSGDLTRGSDGSDAIEMEYDSQHRIPSSQSIVIPFQSVNGRCLFVNDIYSSSLSSPIGLVHAVESDNLIPQRFQHDNSIDMYSQNRPNIAIPIGNYNYTANY